MAPISSELSVLILDALREKDMHKEPEKTSHVFDPLPLPDDWAARIDPTYGIEYYVLFLLINE